MNRIIVSDEFKKKVKPLSKKYPSLRESINQLGARLIENPFLGKSYGGNIYKIRLADPSKGKGKSGGFRILYYTRLENEAILFITIYDKSELDTITKRDAEILLKKVLESIDSKT